MRTLVIDRRENKLDGNDELGSLWMSNRPSDQNNPNKNQEYKVSRGGTQTFASFKVILSSYATIAALYTRWGNIKKAEQAYEKYIIEVSKAYTRHHGTLNIPTSDCYFNMGIFYLENDMLQKAEKCFEKTLYIRK